MAEDYLVEDSEYQSNKTEEDPILVAQRYLNIFHQIHIFNAAKKEEFDNSLLQMSDKVKELLATIPGGRVLLEHLEKLEDKQGLSSSGTKELITNNLEQEKKSIDKLEKAAGAGGSVSLGADFAETLAKSLAAALGGAAVQNAATGAAPAQAGTVNVNDLNTLLSRSFNLYAGNMQKFTENLLLNNVSAQKKITETAMQQMQQRSAGVIAHTAAARPAQTAVPPQPAVATAAQQNTQNSNSTTINNVNMDSSVFNSLAQVLAQSDAHRHSDFVQMIEALRNNIAVAAHGNASPAAAQDYGQQTQDFATMVAEALKENNTQQIEAIKSFGEVLIQALTQSQQELAQTLAQSSPRHTVKVVVSQDIDVENQTGTQANALAQPKLSAPAAPKNSQPQKNEPEAKEKTNFIKNFSDKISETTGKLAQNISSGNAKNSSGESLINKINKGINKIGELKNDLKNELKNRENNQPAKNEAKPNKKEQQNTNNAKNAAANQTAQPKNQQKTTAPQVKENKPQSAPKAPVTNPAPQAAAKKPEPENKTGKELNLDDMLADIPDSSPVFTSAEKTKVPEQKPQPQNIAPKPAPPVSKPAPAATGQNPQQQPVSPSAQTTERRKNHSYDDALQKIKNALNEDAYVSLNDLDVKPVSLDDDKTPARQAAAEVKKSAQNDYEEISLDDDEDFDRLFNKSSSATDDEEWEYVDEDGNPVSGDDDGEWEYVDENGNPVSGDDDGEWEYVDEDGNPVSGDDDGEWEYVDEDGNPVDDAGHKS